MQEDKIISIRKRIDFLNEKYLKLKEIEPVTEEEETALESKMGEVLSKLGWNITRYSRLSNDEYGANLLFARNKEYALDLLNKIAFRCKLGPYYEPKS